VLCWRRTNVLARHSLQARLALASLDILIVVIGFYAAYYTRQALPLERQFFLATTTQALLLTFCPLAMVLAARWTGVYDAALNAGLLRQVRLALQQTLAGGLAIIVFEYLWRLDLSRAFLAVFFCYSFLLILLVRGLVLMSARRYGRRLVAPIYTYVVGSGPAAQRVAEILHSPDALGFTLKGFFSPDPERALVSSYPVYPLSELPRMLRQHVIDELIFAVDPNRLGEFEELLLICDEEGVRTRFPIDFFPHVNSRPYIDRLGPATFVSFSAAPHDEVPLMLKRIVDILFSGIALILLFPFMLLIAALIRLTSPGPVLFKQVRCGLNGRRFYCLKFRTMVADAEQRKAGVAHLNVKRTAFKIPNDPRVTPLGRWLRKFSIDEWPQLWNVLRGEMSLVGPRPAVPEEVDRYERWQRRRLRMRPGLTCLWTLEGRDELEFEEWMRLDLAYIDNWSLSLDWGIILRTVPYVLTGRGAH